MSKYTLQVKPHSEIDPRTWDQFIEASPQGGPFAWYDFAKAIRPDWQALIVSDKSGWQAVMPFCLNKKMGFTYLPQPAFSQYWGIYFAPWEGLSVYRSFSQKRDLIQAMLPFFEDVDLFINNFSPAFDYPLPFHWAEFELKTRYTYRLYLGWTLEEHRQMIEPSLRRQIKKTERRGYRWVSVDQPTHLAALYDAQKETGKDLEIHEPERKESLKRLSKMLIRQKRGEIGHIVDESGKVLAAGLFAYYRQTTYYLAGTFNPESPDSGAMSRLLWEGIQRAMEKNHQIFDFEGSMIKGVEHFFRKFGAHPVPYLQIHKNQLPLPVRWINGLR
ncbi:MAG: GNAT family N-acetyltransferase [Bacteroidota bacterium]